MPKLLHEVPAVTLVLHDYELSADAYRVRLMLGLLGVDHVRIAVDVYPGRETDIPAFRALNPRGTVPVLVDGDLVLTTPEAILCHVAARFDPTATWLPADLVSRARCLDWLAFSARDLKPADEARLADMLSMPSAFRDPVGLARRAYRALDDHLVRQTITGSGYLAGDRPTVADVAVFPSVALAVEFGCALEEHPKLRMWARRIRSLPGFVGMPGIPEFI